MSKYFDWIAKHDPHLAAQVRTETDRLLERIEELERKPELTRTEALAMYAKGLGWGISFNARGATLCRSFRNLDDVEAALDLMPR